MTEPVTPPRESASDAVHGEATQLYGFAGTVAFFTLLSRIFGMTRDLVIAHVFGASGASDAWVQAFRIPNALRRLTAEGSMTIAFVPTYVRVRAEQGPEVARAFARKVLGIVLGATMLLAALGMVFNQFLTAVFSPGFRDDPVKFELAAKLLVGMFPYLVLVSLVAWAMGVLNSEGRFAAPAAAPIFLNVGIIVAVLGFSGRMAEPILAVAWGIVAGGVVQVVLQVPSLLKVGVRPLPLPGWRDPALARLFRLLVPSLVGVAVYQVNIIVLGVIASYLPTGQIFNYNNATRLTELVMGLFAFAFTTAGLPALSEHVAREDWPRLRETLRLTFSATQFTILPAMVGLVVAGEAIVSMLYLHGAFTYADVTQTANTLMLMALGMPAVAAVRVMVPTFYAFDDARSPVIAAALTLGVTAALGWWLSRTYEVEGLAAGLTLGTWFQCGVLAFWLRRKTRPIGRWFPREALLRQGVPSLAMGAAAYLLQRHGVWERGPFALANWAVFGSVVVGGACLYFGMTLLLREPQAWHWLALLRRLGRRLRRRSGTDTQ
ncbi:MAG TPA: murein biosynthesis integral membrane protein MurJ [bacterium]|nr:murein biosynthesis integral membrane protein MurJ [bacterium]